VEALLQSFGNPGFRAVGCAFVVACHSHGRRVLQFCGIRCTESARVPTVNLE
jgi:hypothetical protein